MTEAAVQDSAGKSLDVMKTHCNILSCMSFNIGFCDRSLFKMKQIAYLMMVFLPATFAAVRFTYPIF